MPLTKLSIFIIKCILYTDSPPYSIFLFFLFFHDKFLSPDPSCHQCIVNNYLVLSIKPNTATPGWRLYTHITYSHFQTLSDLTLNHKQTNKCTTTLFLLVPIPKSSSPIVKLYKWKSNPCVCFYHFAFPFSRCLCIPFPNNLVPFSTQTPCMSQPPPPFAKHSHLFYSLPPSAPTIHCNLLLHYFPPSLPPSPSSIIHTQNQILSSPAHPPTPHPL